MAEIEFEVNKKIYDFLENSNFKVNVIYGGAGSGKSYTVTQFLILDRLLNRRNKRLLVTRKTNTALIQTAYRLFLEWLEKFEIKYDESKSKQMILLPNRSEIVFRGMDDSQKIKSSEFNYIWMEEATEFTKEDYLQLKLRLRRASNVKNQMYLTFNPVHSWATDYFLKTEDKEVNILHTTYLDNLYFLDDDYVQTLEDLINQDESFYQIYTLGEVAELKNKVYNNYVIVKDVPTKFDEIIYGVDFGFNNPSVILEIGLKDDNIYITKELYETHLTNEELIERLKTFVYSKNAEIYADSAEPARIEEIARAGFNIYPAKKDVKDGIDFLKRKMIYLYKDCTNTIKEIQMYKWKESKNGEILDEPVKFNDHAMDAMRYAVYTYQNRARVEIL